MIDSMHDLFRLRSTLEAFAATRLRESPQRAEVMENLRNRMATLHHYASQGDYENFHAADMDFHRAMVTAVGLDPLTQSWEQTARATDTTILALKREYWPSLMALYRDHIYLMNAWESEDLQASEQATHQHLEMGWHLVHISETGGLEEGGVVDRVAAFLSTYYASEIDMKWVAQNIGFVSAGHLTRKFQVYFGIPPYAWLRKLRLERAAQLLASTHEDIVKIGTRVGYKNASHFTRDFRKQFEVTPKQYRLEPRTQ